MKSIINISISLVVLIAPLNGQTSLTLKDCLNAAMENHSLREEKKLLGQISEMNVRNISNGWYPTIDAGANFVYNTSVVDLGSALESLPIPGIADNIGSMPHDQYKLTIDIQQVIWDGGAIGGRRDVENKSLQVKEQEVEIELYKVKEQVTGYYFRLMMLKKQDELHKSYLDLVNRRIEEIQSGVKNGILLETDRDILRAEGIRIEQQIAENMLMVKSVVSILSDITGLELSQGMITVLPEIETEETDLLSRPELGVFNSRIEQLEAGKSVIKSSRMPKAFGFATLGYGNPPGNDFFTDEFGSYATVGAGLKWNILDWNKSKREMQVIDLHKEIILNRRIELEENLNRLLELKEAEILSFELMLDSDKKLIELRQSILKTSESKLRNGTITSTEYIAELNAEKQAVINYELHKVSLVKARAEYLIIAGQEIK